MLCSDGEPDLLNDEKIWEEKLLIKRKQAQIKSDAEHLIH